MAGQVESYLEKSCYASKITLVYESTLLGTGGTVLKNRDFFDNSPFLVAHADNLTIFNPHFFIEAHQNRPFGTKMTMMTFETDMPQSCGIVQVDKNNVVQNFYEKTVDPPGSLANAAVYIFEPSIFDFLSTLNTSTIDLSNEVLPHYIGKIYTYYNALYHRDIGTPKSLALARNEFDLNKGMLKRDYEAAVNIDVHLPG